MQFLTWTWERLRVPIAALLALGVVLGGIYIALTFASSRSSGTNVLGTPRPDQEKLDILASLEGTSSATLQQKEETLKKISTAATNTPSEAEKLEILGSLQGK